MTWTTHETQSAEKLQNHEDRQYIMVDVVKALAMQKNPGTEVPHSTNKAIISLQQRQGNYPDVSKEVAVKFTPLILSSFETQYSYIL